VHVSSGWYPDPSRPGTERFWDGTEWTADSQPRSVDLPEEVDLAEEVATVAVRSTVGFELPTYEVLARMGVHAVGASEGDSPGGARDRADDARDASTPARSRRRALKALSVVLGAAVVATGSFVPLGRHSDADAAVVAAVNSSLSDRSADVAISGSGSAVGNAFSLQGTGAIDFTQNAMQVSLDVTDGTKQVHEQAVYQNDVVYVKVGNAIGQIVPGKSWVSLTQSQLSSVAGVSSFGSNDTVGSDPAAALQSLRQSGNGGTDLGSSVVDGAHVEGYAVQVTNPHLVYKVYVDSAGQLVQLTTDLNETLAGQDPSETTTMDFSNYGTPVSVTPPPTSEVAPFQTFLKAAMALSAPSGSLD
jgi:hypothetical protein